MNRSNSTIEFCRIDARDAEHIADGGIGGGAAALAENVPPVREADDVVHGEEIRREVELVDQREFFFDDVARLFAECRPGIVLSVAASTSDRADAHCAVLPGGTGSSRIIDI